MWSFEHQGIIDRVLQILLRAQVPFRRQDRLVTQQKLNLFHSSSPPFARQGFAAVRRSCRMRHERRYAESRIMPSFTAVRAWVKEAP